MISLEYVLEGWLGGNTTVREGAVWAGLGVISEDCIAVIGICRVSSCT